MTVRILVLVGSLLTTSTAVAQPRPEVPKTEPPEDYTNIRKRTSAFRGAHFEGVVEQVDCKTIRVACEARGNDPAATRDFPLVDLLAEGKLLKHADGCFAYHWKDVKKGDTVCVRTLEDSEEKVRYCLAIRITRRPGAKLPQGSDPKKDGSYPYMSLLNDIENGEDVDDALIAKLCPPTLNPETRAVEIPGGLRKEWQDKLDAIRAKKKDKDLKATPPDKK